jgi:hypothetical protein
MPFGSTSPRSANARPEPATVERAAAVTCPAF